MFKSKNEVETRSPAPAVIPVTTVSPARPKATADGSVSTFGAGMLIKGSIVCEGAMQVFGRIYGEIHAVTVSYTHLTLPTNREV